MAEYISTLTGAQMDASLLDMANHTSEAWAVGERNGVPVSSSDPVYNKHAKYWAQHIADTGHPPYIGTNGNWYEWDGTLLEYVDTGVHAKGDTGEDASVTASEFGTSTSSSTLPTSWSTTMPVLVGGEFLWTRFTWNNGTYSYTCARQGADGDMQTSVYDPQGTVAQAGGIPNYVDANGGKIDHIKVNNVEQAITNKTVNIPVPTALSGLTDDATHRLVTDTEKSTWNAKYSKPSGGVPDSDIASASTWNAKSSKANVLTGTLTVGGWSSNTQTLTISGLATSGYAYTVAPTSADASKWITAKCLAQDITTANRLTVTCETTPTASINVVILKTEVQ